MSTGLRRWAFLPLGAVLALLLLAGLLTLAGLERSSVHAAVPTGSSVRLPAVHLAQSGPYTPVVTITMPAANEVLTSSAQAVYPVQVAYSCGTSCTGSALLDVVSVTVDGGVTYHEALSGVVAGLYVYSWTLPTEDRVAHMLIARARNGYGQIGTSKPMTVWVDRVMPTVVITGPERWAGLTPIPLRWNAQDGSGIRRVRLHVLTGTDWQEAGPAQTGLSGTFFFTPTENLTYTFTLQATDGEGNQSPLPGPMITVTVQPVRVYLPAVVRDYPLPWRQGANTAGKVFRTPSGCKEKTWYAGTSGDDGVWKSTDGAETWEKVADLKPYAYPVVANPSNCDEAFVAVWGPGVYRIQGGAATPINNGLGELYLYGLALSGTTLYAGTSSQGIYRTAIDNIAWTPANEGINDKRIRSLYAAEGKLYAGARGCTLYVSGNGGATWSEFPIPVQGGCDDAQVWSLAPAQGALYAGLGQEKGLYVLEGTTWSRVEAIPAKTIYGLAYDDTYGYLYVSAYGAGVYRCRIDGSGRATTCSPHNEGLTTAETREITIHGGLVVVGSNDGVWYRPLLP